MTVSNRDRIANMLRNELGVTPTEKDIQTVLDVVEPPPPAPKERTDAELLRIVKNCPTGFAKDLIHRLYQAMESDELHLDTSSPSLKMYRSHLHHFIARLMWYTHPEFYEAVCQVESGANSQSEEEYRKALKKVMDRMMQSVVSEMLSFAV